MVSPKLLSVIREIPSNRLDVPKAFGDFGDCGRGFAGSLSEASIQKVKRTPCIGRTTFTFRFELPFGIHSLYIPLWKSIAGDPVVGVELEQGSILNESSDACRVEV